MEQTDIEVFVNKYQKYLAESEWNYERIIIPQTCFVTNKLLWIKKHYKIKIYMNDIKRTITVYIDSEIGTMIRLMI